MAPGGASPGHSRHSRAQRQSVPFGPPLTQGSSALRAISRRPPVRDAPPPPGGWPAPSARQRSVPPTRRQAKRVSGSLLLRRPGSQPRSSQWPSVACARRVPGVEHVGLTVFSRSGALVLGGAGPTKPARSGGRVLAARSQDGRIGWLKGRRPPRRYTRGSGSHPRKRQPQGNRTTRSRLSRRFIGVQTCRRIHRG